MISAKDVQRMDTLIAYSQAHGLAAALQKAVRDADKIERLEKCEARATVLENRNQRALAGPFRSRAAFLVANGVTV